MFPRRDAQDIRECSVGLIRARMADKVLDYVRCRQIPDLDIFIIKPIADNFKYLKYLGLRNKWLLTEKKCYEN